MASGHNNDNDDDERKDLTRIENLSEFLHEEDPDLESKFNDFNTSFRSHEATSTEVTAGVDLNDLEEDIPSLPDIPEETEETSEETLEMLEEIPGEPSEESSFDFSDEAPSDDLLSMPDVPEEFPNEETPVEEETSFFEESTESLSEESILSHEVEVEEEEMETIHQEKFEEVKTFAQNFSYGQIQGGGNPPFSLVIRNLKFDEDKESIISLLSEFGLINDQNIDDTNKALELGHLLIPQISEYSAIILAHKFRRFDCDIEMGLSDEIHPSKSGEQNPKGLVKKESLRQNKVERVNLGDQESVIREVLVTTLPTLEGHIIKKYIGVQTSFTIVEEDELERLKFVQQQERLKRTVYEYAPEESGPLTSEKAFLDYKSSFDYLFVTLAEDLKSKAKKEKANALLGLTYQLQPLPFEKTANGKNCYQLTASATLAEVIPE